MIVLSNRNLRESALSFSEAGQGFQTLRAQGQPYIVLNALLAFTPGEFRSMANETAGLVRFIEQFNAQFPTLQSRLAGNTQELVSQAISDLGKLASIQDEANFDRFDDVWRLDSEIWLVGRDPTGFSEFFGPGVFWPTGGLETEATLNCPEIFVRFSAFKLDLRVDLVLGTVRPGTYFTTWLDGQMAPSGLAAVGRYALPNPVSAQYAFQMKVMPFNTMGIYKCGTVRPKFNQAGGGVEVFFPNQLPPPLLELGWYQLPEV
jgi:hypothetical protein